jgi:hypothetical protein
MTEEAATKEPGFLGTEGSAGAAGSPRSPLVLIRGEASETEVAALLAVLQALSATAASTGPATAPVPGWAAPVRRLRVTYPAGPGAWRASGLPR